MKKTTFPMRLLTTMWVAGTLTLVGCTDSNYDLGDLDKTLALGSDRLELPSSSTKDIILDDILDLDDSESVIIDANGNYNFEQSSTIDDVTVNVDIISVSQGGTDSHPVTIEGVTPFPTGTPENYETDYTGSDIDGTIETFNYTSGPQEDVVSLQSATVEGTLDLEVTFSSKLRAVVETFTTMSIEIPPFMEYEITSMPANGTKVGNNIVFTNVSTDDVINIKVNITKLDFDEAKNQSELGSVKINADKSIVLVGSVKVHAEIAKVKNRASIADDGNPDYQILSVMNINNIRITKATGCFDPKITVQTTTIDLNDLPDFLTDEDVVVDLYNPQIELNVHSTMPIPGLISGTLIARGENNEVIETVALPVLRINDNGDSHICIARRDEGIDHSAYTQVEQVPNLSDIIKKVPKTIEFIIEARAAQERDDYEFEMGTDYVLSQMEYAIKAPLAFGETAKIIYNETEDGWAEDMPEEVDLEDGAYILVTTNMESTVPAWLTMNVQAIDAAGNDIDNVTCVVDKQIAPSADGVTPTTTPLIITIKEKSGKGMLTQVDGIRFTINASSSDQNQQNVLVGQTLNANRNKLVAKDIRVTLVGRVIADLN